MAHFTSCQNCGNDEHGDWLYLCDECHLRYCDACRHKDMFNITECPRCGTYKNTRYGQIDNEILNTESSDDDDEDEEDDDDDYSSSNYSSSRDRATSESYSSSPNSSSGSGAMGIISSIVGMTVASLIFFWAHGLFEESKNMSEFSIKGGLGPAFGILCMIGSVIGFVISLTAFFASLGRK